MRTESATAQKCDAELFIGFLPRRGRGRGFPAAALERATDTLHQKLAANKSVAGTGPARHYAAHLAESALEGASEREGQCF